jgi:hypothetical protein
MNILSIEPILKDFIQNNNKSKTKNNNNLHKNFLYYKSSHEEKQELNMFVIHIFVKEVSILFLICV